MNKSPVMIRESFVDRMTQLAEKAKKKAASRTEVIPNRKDMRKAGINRLSTNKPFSRVTSGTRLTPASLYTMIAIHQVKPNGTVVKFVIPRTMLNEGETSAEQ